MSWNINSIKNKLESEETLKLILMHDIVFINEIKCAYNFSVAGFKTFVSKLDTKSPNRGGTAMLVKNWLVPHITSIDFSCVDQIWVKLSLYPKVEIGGCYITPHDSPFYSHQSVAHIQEKVLSNSDMDYILIGDLNCRFGNLLDSLQLPAGWKRGVSVDNRQQPNFNGRNIFHVFRDCGLIPINNISSSDRSFKGNFTFRMRQRWISELDWCVCTPNVLSFISDMAINNTAC